MPRRRPIKIKAPTPARIRQLWRDSGIGDMDQREAAAVIGCTEYSIHRYLRGESLPPMLETVLMLWQGATEETREKIRRLRLAD